MGQTVFLTTEVPQIVRLRITQVSYSCRRFFPLGSGISQSKREAYGRTGHNTWSQE